MQYYLIEWDHEEPDEPWRLFLEMEGGRVRRKVEVYRTGLYETSEVTDSEPADPRQLAGQEGFLSSLNRVQFEDMWDQARSMPDSFMGLFY